MSQRTGEKNIGEWPFERLMHWPPLTYRDALPVTHSTMSCFTDYLNSESKNNFNRELQPWVPFCSSKCAFCYFAVSCRTNYVSPYISALKKALLLYAKSKYVKSCIFNEVYVGGGSPSVLSKKHIADLLQFCRKNFNLSPVCSIKFTTCTIGLSEEKLRFLSSQEIDQIDVGVQTFNDYFRKMLKLQDNSSEVKTKLKIAKKHNLRVSIDLLYNLPGQSLEQWEKDVRQALELNVESVDCYPLDLYPDTLLAKQVAAGELPPPNDGSVELEMYLKAFKIFTENGYVPSCHNRFTRIKEDLAEPSSEVVGTGSGFFMGHVGNFLYSDVENIKEYISVVSNGIFPLSKIKILTREDEMKNAMMLLYVRVPVERRKFKEKFGVYPEEAFPDAIKTLQEKQLIEIREDKIKLTETGDPWRFNIAWEFFKDENRS